MECPNCLEKLSASGINAYDCLYCNGNWLTGTLIYDLLIKDKKNPSIEQLQISFKKQNENNIKKSPLIWRLVFKTFVLTIILCFQVILEALKIDL